MTLFAKARADRVVLPITDVDVPQVRELGKQLDDIVSLTFAADALGPLKLIDCQADGDSAAIPDRVLGFFEHLTKQSDPVLQTTPIFVTA